MYDFWQIATISIQSTYDHRSQNQACISLFCTFNASNVFLVEAWYSLEQYIGLKEDKLSSTTVDFIRPEGNLETIHEELIPVSIKLKSTLDTRKARQIIRKAEKDLLQARVKAINNILDQVDKEIQDCRAKLASIISQERLEQCQGFINKVSELRFNKVKQRQINKLNHLVSKKEGNITIINNNTTLNRQVQSLPSSRSRNPTRLLLSFLPGKETTLPGSCPPSTGRKQFP